jgi:hypothetical protein
VKTAHDRALDIAYDLAASQGEACVSKAAFVALAVDSGKLGADIRKLLGIIERHIEADRAEQRKAALS